MYAKSSPRAPRRKKADRRRAVFIRAPLISRVGEGVRVLARLDADRGERIVAVRQGNVLATSVHPELTPDLRLHQYFLDMLA